MALNKHDMKVRIIDQSDKMFSIDWTNEYDNRFIKNEGEKTSILVGTKLLKRKFKGYFGS